jgi:hypothetical protein
MTDHRQLLEETEWTRVYRTGPTSVFHESKFATDGLEISAEAIKRRWPSMSAQEQMDFVNAFVGKPDLSGDDNEILLFLMDVGSDPVIGMISCLLPKLKNRDRALQFLLDRPVQQNGWAANRYQALAAMGDPRAIPFLRRHYEEYRRILAPLEQRTVWELLDYSACLEALWALDQSEIAKTSFAALLLHPDPQVREHAQQCICENKLQELARGRTHPSSSRRHLVKETEWSRVYCAENNYCWAVSKFRTDGLEFPASSIKARWPWFSLEEKVEFAQAFCQKSTLASEALDIIDLMIREGPEYVRTCVAIHLDGRSNNENAVSFLLKKALDPEASFPAYFGVLWPLAGSRVCLALRERFDDYRASLQPVRDKGIGELSDYIQCLSAFQRMGTWPDVDAALLELQSHPDQVVRRRARPREQR